MSFSVFYAVRFSPAPELGEWLNVAVIGEGISERKAGLVVSDSMGRIEAAFGLEAVERVGAICRDLSNLVSAIASAHERGEETQPITRALRDQALSVSFSDQIMVFEGTFDEALSEIASKYLPAAEEEQTQTASVAVVHEPESDIARLAAAVQHRLVEISRDILPPVISKPPVTKPSETARHAMTILLIGGPGLLRSALSAKLSAEGNSVRVLDPKIAEEPHGVAENLRSTIQDVAKQAGVTAMTVSKVLLGEGGAAKFSPGTVDRIRETARELGFNAGGEHRPSIVHGSFGAGMEGADVVIYLADGHNTKRSDAEANEIAQQAKAHGVHRLIVASSCQVYGKGTQTFHEGSALNPETPSLRQLTESEQALRRSSNDDLAVTVLRFAELYGYSEESRRQNAKGSGERWIHLDASVNELAARAVLGQKITVTGSHRQPYLHVEDAVAAIVSALDAPPEVVGGQVYNVGDENQVKSMADIAALIKKIAPNSDCIIAADQSESNHCHVVFSKINSQLGFEPSRTLEEGIAQLIKALQEGAGPARQAAPQGQAKVEVESGSSPGIQWEKLTYTAAEPESQDSTTKQSVKKRP